MTLSFTQSEDPAIANVGVEDILVKLWPGRIPFDVDQDGMLEVIEFGSLTFGSHVFDLERSGGEYELATGLLSLKFIISLGQHLLTPLIGEKLASESVYFEVQEHGWIDFQTGHFETSSRVFTAASGPLAGLTVMGIQATATCLNRMSLGVYILNSGISTEVFPKDVWICPNTPVMLVWEADHAHGGTIKPDHVNIKPEIGDRPRVDQQQIPDPGSLNPALQRPIDQTVQFTATTVGGCSKPAEAKATVNVIEDGEEISQTAAFDRTNRYWIAQLPTHTYDQNITVTEIIIDNSLPDSVTHPSWRLDYLPPSANGGFPVGTVIDSVNNFIPVGMPFPLPGEYRFTPMPLGTSLPDGEEDRTLYFRLKLSCSA